MVGLHLQPLRFEALRIPGNGAVRGIVILFMAGGRLEGKDHCRTAGFNAAEVKPVGGIAERAITSDVIADSIARVQGQPHSVLVKGECNTSGLLKAVLGCLPEGSKHFLSHVAVIENPFAGKLLMVSSP